MKVLAWVALGGLTFSMPEVAFAQELREPEGRQGYYLGASLRSGFLSTSSDALEVGGFQMFGLSFRFGEMVLPWLGFGGLAQFYGGANDDFTTGGGSGAIETQVEPWTETNLAFRLSAGPFFQSVSREDPALARENDPDSAYGLLVSVGASYDIFPFRSDLYQSGGWSLGLYLDGQGWFAEDFESFGVFGGIEIGHFFGLARSKLDLPLDEAYR